MSLHIPILPAIFFSLGIGLVIASNFVFYTILGEVNAHLSPDKQFSIFFINVKASQVTSLHKQMYPNSRKRQLELAFFIAGLTICVATIALNIEIV